MGRTGGASVGEAAARQAAAQPIQREAPDEPTQEPVLRSRPRAKRSGSGRPDRSPGPTDAQPPAQHRTQGCLARNEANRSRERRLGQAMRPQARWMPLLHPEPCREYGHSCIGSCGAEAKPERSSKSYANYLLFNSVSAKAHLFLSVVLQTQNAGIR